MVGAAYSFRMGNELGILRKKYRMVQAVLDERGRRVWAASEAISLPHGGVSLVAQATISNTKTKTGLKIKAKLTQRTYLTGVEISASEIAKLNLTPEVFHGDWNYSVLPQ